MFGIKPPKETQPENPPQQNNDARHAAHPDQPATSQPVEAGQEPLTENFTTDVYVKKEVSQVSEDTGEPIEFQYTRNDGRIIFAAADSELMKQLDMQIDKQPAVGEPKLDANEQGAVASGHAAPNGPEGEYARPEFQVLDQNNNVIRSYNVGLHGEAAESKAEQYAAKVNGTVRRLNAE